MFYLSCVYIGCLLNRELAKWGKAVQYAGVKIV
jgi:hypothetical protein